MGRGFRLLALSSVASLMVPSPAFAANATVPRILDLGVGVVALVLAAVLLLDVLALRRVASGAAIAEHVTHVMAAVVCLAAAVILRWLVRFSSEASIRSLASLGSDLLVIAAMAFFALYFYLVRRAMVRFLRPVSAEEAIALAQVVDAEDGIDDELRPLPAEERRG